MGGAGRLRRRYTRPTTIGLVGMSVASAILWGIVSEMSPGSPIAELPQAAAATFVLGAASLSATSRAGAFLQDRTLERDPSVRWPSVVTTCGLFCVILSVLVSLVLFLNGMLYFALERAWPITPSRAGAIQFYLLAAIVLVPVAVSILAVADLVSARARSG